MATVIDSLVLELGLDSTKFTRGQQQAMASLRQMEEGARRQGTEVESQSKKILDLLSTVRRETIGALAGLFGGSEARAVFDHLINLDAATGRFSRTLDMNVREVSAWQGAFQQIGGSAESANAALSGLSGEMARFQLTGQSAMLPVLSRLGVRLYDQNHQLKTAGELWLELADAVQGMDPRQAAQFLRMIPGANPDMINLLLKGRAAVETYLAAARAAGGTTAQSAAAAQEYQKQLSLLERQATSLSRSIIGGLLPGLNSLLGIFREIIRSGPTGGKSLWDYLTTLPSLSVAKGSSADVFWRGLKGEYGYDFGRFFGDLYAGLGGGAGRENATRAEGIARLKDAFAALSGAGAMAPNWVNFLSGLSYLETSQRNVGNSSSSAQGYFQFLSGTASRATAQGLPDPRLGSYAQQAAATAAYIRRFHPNAAAAIDRGDYAAAIAELSGEWPSLPGGSQPQSAARYATFADELRGGGPRPASAPVVNVGGVVVYTSASDGNGIARDIDGALKRSLTAGAANYGPQ